MPLESGSRLGPYEILSLIGVGGMGEVYKAKDTRLDRTVAIKVLPSHLSDNAERRERFEREARVVSSLNHPNICTLHDVGEQNGTHFLVMEYIEGETLADQLMKGPLPLDQALRYGIEIADALDKAHRQCVVHRDLKPGNIMLTKPGAKLLDFGLAKFRNATQDEDLSNLPTAQKPLTEKGAILGTFQYMSPEQLEGKEADARTDIFAFGSVLYEMVTGKRAFEGKSQASLISSILRDDPPTLATHQPLTPPALDHVIKTCLAKDPDERWQTTGDIGRQLQWINERGSKIDESKQVTSNVLKRTLASALAILLTAAVTGIAFWSLMPQEPRAVTRTSISIPATNELVGGIDLSLDGKELVYVGVRDGTRQLYRRSMEQLEASPIQGTEGAELAFFSPDGEWVGFFADGKLKKVSLSGGPPVTICDAGASFGARRWWASWGPDDTIVFAHTGPSTLKRVQAAGGKFQPLTTLDTEQSEIGHSGAHILPGGKAMLFDVYYGFKPRWLAALSLKSGQHKMLIEGHNPRYSPTGHIVFNKEGAIWAVPFDAERLEVTGSATPLIESVRDREFAFADNGSLVYMPGSGSQLSQLVWVDREGRAAPALEERLPYASLQLSPEGQRVVVGIEGDIWLGDLERGTLNPLTFGAGKTFPLWTPDGERVTFAKHDRHGIDWRSVDGIGEGEELMTGGEHRIYPNSWSPDGKALVFHETKEGQRDLWIFSLEGDRTPVPLIVTSFNERFGRFSPDGNWLAYASDESGRDEVFVQPYPGRGGKVPASIDGGTEPVWCSQQGDLFYRNGSQMIAVSVETTPTLEVGVPRVLFEGDYRGAGSGGGQSYDVSPDCQRFLMLQESDPASPTQLVVVLNWFEELKRLSPAD